MRKLVILAIAMLGAAFPAHAGANDVVIQGTVTVPNPVGIGITETATPCDDTTPLQGFDTYWIHLPAGTAGRPATLVADDAANDVDAYFYSAACDYGYKGYNSSYRWSSPGNHSGTIPADTEWIAVEFAAGSPNASFTLTIDMP